MESAPSFFTVMATGQLESADVSSCDVGSYQKETRAAATSAVTAQAPEHRAAADAGGAAAPAPARTPPQHRSPTATPPTASLRWLRARTGSCLTGWRPASRKLHGNRKVCLLCFDEKRDEKQRHLVAH